MFNSPKPTAPLLNASSWDLPKSANKNWEKYGSIEVFSSCGYDEAASYCDATDGEPKIQFVTTVIGTIPQMWEDDAVGIVNEAVASYAGGTGTWTAKTTMQDRVRMLRNILEEMNVNREEIISLLMWEINKNYDDAAAEIDSTLEFFDHLAYTVLSDPQYSIGQWQDIPSGTTTTSALTKRTALGVVIVTTYGLLVSDVYRILLPALLTGNVVVFKMPIQGGLIHIYTQSMFARHLPPGTMYIVCAPGPMVLPEMLATGKVDGFAYIGKPGPVDNYTKENPTPHKTKTFLQLSTRNVAVVLPDIMDSTPHYENAMKEIIDGSLEYNGSLSTSIKVIFVPKIFADQFVLDLAERVEKVTIGLPWQKFTIDNDDGSTTIEYPKITPLINVGKVHEFESVLDDAVQYGARVVNELGGRRVGIDRSSLVRPAVLYPLKKMMKCYSEAVDGPMIMVATYDSNMEEVYDFIDHNEMSQQISIFGLNSTIISKFIDRYSTSVGRININTKCSRSPDIIPFTVRRSGGKGIMSTIDILKEFTIPTVLSHKDHDMNDQLMEDITNNAMFLGGTKVASATK